MKENAAARIERSCALIQRRHEALLELVRAHDATLPLFAPDIPRHLRPYLRVLENAGRLVYTDARGWQIK